MVARNFYRRDNYVLVCISFLITLLVWSSFCQLSTTQFRWSTNRNNLAQISTVTIRSVATLNQKIPNQTNPSIQSIHAASSSQIQTHHFPMFYLNRSFVSERSKLIVEYVSDNQYCTGKHNARRCSSGKLYELLEFPHTSCNPTKAKSRRTIVTPWAMIEHLYFTGNDYLDLIVYDIFFKHRFRGKKGFYVEIGASDGVAADNTLFFEDCLEWNGLLVETTACAICQVPFNRPSATIEHFAICDLGNFFDPRPMKGFCTSNHPHCVEVKNSLRQVPCSPVQNILDKHNITRIDFLSIDIEEASEFALDTIDFSRVSIDVILVECRQRRRCEKKLTSLGFQYIWIKGDILAWK